MIALCLLVKTMDLNLNEYKHTDEFQSKEDVIMAKFDIINLLGSTIERPFSILFVDRQDAEKYKEFANCEVYEIPFALGIGFDNALVLVWQ